MKKICTILIISITLLSCNSLKLQYGTLNHVSSVKSIYKQSDYNVPIYDTDYFNINAPLSIWGWNNSNYGNSWANFGYHQYWIGANNYWQPNYLWRYPAYRWAYDNWRYNIPVTPYSPYVGPTLQPEPRLPRIRQPRERPTRVRVKGRRGQITENNSTILRVRRTSNTIPNEIININPRRSQSTQGSNNGGRSRSRQVIPTQPTVPRQPRTIQPRQIRRGSGSPSTQQPVRSNSSNQQGRSTSNRRQK